MKRTFNALLRNRSLFPTRVGFATNTPHETDQTQAIKDGLKLMIKHATFKHQTINFGTTMTYLNDNQRDMLLPLHTVAYKYFLNTSFNEKKFLETCKETISKVYPLLLQQNMEEAKPYLTNDCLNSITKWSERMTRERFHCEGGIESVNALEIQRIRVKGSADLVTQISVFVNVTECTTIRDASGDTIAGDETNHNRESNTTWIFVQKGVEKAWKIHAIAHVPHS
jgi:hypothetical protein